MTARPTLPPVDCFAWCEYRDGHADAWHPDDQWCGTPIRKVPTAAYPLVEMSDGTWRGEEIWVSGLAWHHGPAPTIEIAVGECSGIRVSIDEARQIAARILEVADEMSAR